MVWLTVKAASVACITYNDPFYVEGLCLSRILEMAPDCHAYSKAKPQFNELGFMAEDVGFEPTRVVKPARVPGV